MKKIAAPSRAASLSPPNILPIPPPMATIILKEERDWCKKMKGYLESKSDCTILN